MPKVSQEHLERRRQQILEAATECFARQGFRGTSMQDIFDASGLSAGAVYRLITAARTWRIFLRLHATEARSGAFRYQLSAFRIVISGYRMAGGQDPSASGSQAEGGGSAMPPNHDDAPRRSLRADARDNRRRLLEAARDVLIERGPTAPLDEIARRAGTGIATLYRHFPDRQALIRAVILDGLQRTNDEARQAVGEEPDPFSALACYMHRTIDVRTAAVIPALLAEAPLDDEEIRQAHRTGSALLEALVGAAHRTGTLRGDVTPADIGLLIVRMSRPLPGGFPPETNNNLSHRHLNLLIDGLRATAPQPAQLDGSALTFDYPRQLPQPDTCTPRSPQATPATSTRLSRRVCTVQSS
jgi:AcrR family transcriptional regulator